MKTRIFWAISALAFVLPIQAQWRASRYSSLNSARNLMLTTTSGTTYYYLVTTNDTQMMRLSADSLHIGQDAFAKEKIRSMRFHALPRLLLNEDSTTYDKSITLDHGLVALRRTLALEQWNSLVLPFELTGQQLRGAFGEDAQLATVRGVSEEDQTVVEFQTIDISADDAVVLRANYHYLLRPTKDPDVAAASSVTGFSTGRLKGPIYLFPNVSKKANQTPRSQLLKSADGETQVRFRGTYTLLDGSTTSNKKVQPDVYALDDDTHEFTFHTDSLEVSAFRSWIIDLSADPKPLHFYIDGVELTDGIEGVQSSLSTVQSSDDAVYDLNGRKVASHPSPLAPSHLKKGIYIVNGRKVVIK